MHERLGFNSLILVSHCRMDKLLPFPFVCPRRTTEVVITINRIVIGDYNYHYRVHLYCLPPSKAAAANGPLAIWQSSSNLAFRLHSGSNRCTYIRHSPALGAAFFSPPFTHIFVVPTFANCFGCRRRRPSGRILNEFLKFQGSLQHSVHFAIINRISQLSAKVFIVFSRVSQHSPFVIVCERQVSHFSNSFCICN